MAEKKSKQKTSPKKLGYIWIWKQKNRERVNELRKKKYWKKKNTTPILENKKKKIRSLQITMEFLSGISQKKLDEKYQLDSCYHIKSVAGINYKLFCSIHRMKMKFAAYNIYGHPEIAAINEQLSAMVAPTKD